MMICDIRINDREIYSLQFVNLKISIGLKTQYSVKSIHFDEKGGAPNTVIRTLWHNPKDGALKLLQEGIRKIEEKE